MAKFVALAIPVLLVMAVIATYARYESLDPCDWMVHDLADHYGLPRVVAEARIRAGFLLDGITEPDAGDCLLEWWDWRSEGIPEEG